jgi:hypothetical protein
MEGHATSIVNASSERVHGQCLAPAPDQGGISPWRRRNASPTIFPGPPVTSTTVPLPGEAFFYLVRPVTLSGPGSYDSAGPGQIEGRDLEIADSGHGCP